jgi:2-haloacid dehalogenase
MARRDLLKSLVTPGALQLMTTRQATAQQNTGAMPKVSALVFDVFGTVVDWPGSIAREGVVWGKSKNLQIDWGHFADRWRAGYAPAMDKVRKGEIPWTRLDDLHRMLLDQLLIEFNITGLSEEEKDHWNKVWHRLKPWPDSIAGLTRLKRTYIIAPLSNGNIALMTDMARNSGLPWDVILGAELVRHYKPDKEVYLSAPYFLGLKSSEVMMCAAHSGDLKAARECGLRTAFIHRPNEYGGLRAADAAKTGDFDVVSSDMLDLAVQMGR